jgi:hypothetical protein
MDDLSKLKYIDLKGLFEHLPTLERVDWFSISPNGQSAGKANRKNTRIELFTWNWYRRQGTSPGLLYYASQP